MGELDQPGTAIVPARATPFDFEGQTYRAGDSLRTTDACRLLNFASAFNAANPSVGRTNGTRDAWQKFGAACAAGPAATPADAPGSAPTTGNPATSGGDSGEDQGAPAPSDPPLVAAGPPPDPTTPAAPAQTDEPRRPADGQTDPAQVRSTPDSPVLVSDPVDIFSGAYVAQETDLEIPNTILPLALVRSYRSGVPAFGPFGWNWDHNFNMYLRELATGDVAIWRTLHEDVFRYDGATFQPPRGIFERLEHGAVDQQWVLRGAGGTTQWFERPGGWVDGERIPLVRIEDRHGNALRLAYGADDHLVEVRDDDDRFLQFDYDGCGLLVAVSDHVGRRFAYTHDEQTFQLETVTTPPTTDHPLGITRRYWYADPGAPPELRHNIVRVDDASGRTYLEIAYDEDPASLSFARVTEQLFGDYLFQYEYTELQFVPPDDVYANVAARRVEVMNPDYGVETYTFNFAGDLLDERFRLVKDRSYRVVAIQYAYDANGCRTATTRSDGSQELRTYDSASLDPRMRGLLRRRELTAAAGFPVPSRVVWRASYEPVYQLPTEERDERGAITTYEYDFDLTPGAPSNSGKLRRVTLPDTTLPDGTTQAAVTTYEHDARGLLTATVAPDGARTELTYGAAGDAAGRVVSRVHDAGGLAATETYRYDAFGWCSSVTDPAGHETHKTYNALGQVERLALAAVGGQVAEHVMRYDDDRRLAAYERPRGEYDDPLLAGAPIADRFTRDVLGNPVAVRLGANTAMAREVRSQFDHRGFPLRSILPDGCHADRVYDERGRLIAETYTGADGARQTARAGYATNGNLVRSTAPGGGITHYEYDGFGRLRRVTGPNGTEVHRTWAPGDLLTSVEIRGADDLGTVRLLARTDYAYDERGRRVRETVKSFDDDPAVAVDVTTTTFYDAADRIVRTIDQRGAEMRFEHDGLGRVTRTTDPMGNDVERDYDLAGNIVAERHRDIEPDGSVSITTTAYEHDARNRLTATVMPDGTRHATAYDARDLAVSETDALGVSTEVGYDAYGIRVFERRDPAGLTIEHRWETDVLGRTVAYVDPTGSMTTYEYDGLGRRVQTSLPGGPTSARAYDEAGNVTTEQLASGLRIAYDHDAANRLTRLRAVAVPAGVVPIPDQELAYDGLDRLVSARSGVDEVRRRFDSRGRLRRETSGGSAITLDYDDQTGTLTKRWPDGREEEIATDLAGRTTTITQTAAGVLGAGNGLIATLAASGADRPGRTALRGGTTVAHRYDERRRLVDQATTNAAGLAEAVSYRYDAADRRRVLARDGVVPERGVYVFDAAGRVIESAEGFPLALGSATDQAGQDAELAAAVAAAAAASALTETYDYDAADARVQFARSGQPPVAYANGPGHAPATAGAEALAHDADGVRASDGQLAYERDALGRIVAARSGGAIACTLEYDALGRPSTLHETGRPHRTLTWFGSHVEQEGDGDGAIRQHTRDPGTGALLAFHVAGTTRYPLFDGRANLIGLVDANGHLIEAYRYSTNGAPTVLDATGAPIAGSAYDVVPMFGGQRYLPSIERYLSTRRLLDPRHGVFLSGDPLGYAGSPSLYAYAAQDPLDLIDPEGEFAFLAILAVMAIGAVVAGALNATRQGIQMAENPARRAQGFSWGELGMSMGLGGVLAPVLVFAPEVALPLAGLGVAGGAREISHGNYATGTFDIVTSVAPFGFKGVRGSVVGEGTIVGQVRGLGPSAPLSTRAARFDLIGQNLPLLRPAPFGREVGVGLARPARATTGGHAGVVIEDAEGGLSLFHKNAQQTADRSGLEASWALDDMPAPDYPFKSGPAPWVSKTIRVPGSAADAMSAYATARQAAPEQFVFYERSCSNFAADVMGAGNFRALAPPGRTGASGLWQNWGNFTTARNMSHSAGFWANLHDSTPNAKCVPTN